MGAQSGERTHHLSHRPCWARPDGLAQARELLRHGSRLSRQKQDLEILPPHCHCPPSCGLFYCRNRRHVCAIPERFSSAAPRRRPARRCAVLFSCSCCWIAWTRTTQSHGAPPGQAWPHSDFGKHTMQRCCPAPPWWWSWIAPASTRWPAARHAARCRPTSFTVHWCRRAAGSLQALQRGMSSRSMLCAPRNRLSKPEPCH